MLRFPCPEFGTSRKTASLCSKCRPLLWFGVFLGLFHFCRAFRHGRSGIPAVFRAVAGSLATGPVPPGTPVLQGIERFRHRVLASGNPVASAVLTALPGASFLGQIATKPLSFITVLNSIPCDCPEPVESCGSEREPFFSGGNPEATATPEAALQASGKRLFSQVKKQNQKSDS